MNFRDGKIVGLTMRIPEAVLRELANARLDQQLHRSTTPPVTAFRDVKPVTALSASDNAE